MSLINKIVTRVEKINDICFSLGSDIEDNLVLEESIFKIVCTATFENDKMYFNIVFRNFKKEIETTKYEIDWSKMSMIEESLLTTLCKDIAYYVSSINPDHMIVCYNNNFEKVTSRLLGRLSKISEKYSENFEGGYYDQDEAEGESFSIKFEDLITKPSHLLIKMKLKNMILTNLDLYIEKLIINKECPVLLEPLKLGDLCIPSCKHILSKQAYNKIHTTQYEENGVCKGWFKLCPLCRSKLEPCLLY